MRIKLYAAIAFLSVFLVFILQNSQVVYLKFVLWKFNISMIILLLFTFFTGMAAGVLVARKNKTQKKMKIDIMQLNHFRAD